MVIYNKDLLMETLDLFIDKVVLKNTTLIILIMSVIYLNHIYLNNFTLKKIFILIRELI